MSQLPNALSTLGPLNFTDLPQDVNLNAYMSDAFAQAEVIANSVPPPPGGDDFLSSKPSISHPNSAHDAASMTVSLARPPPMQPSHMELQKAWGKPMKINPKENPLEIALYKMAGHDRHGAWFARSSVHEGLGFDKWRRAMRQEFAESTSVEGGPGAGAIRGLAGDVRLEQKEVEGVGTVEVFQLSAQFPGPVAPREFITCLMTSESGLSDASAPHVDSPSVPKKIPRHFLVVSRPCSHPDAPERNGYVRGQYESIEIIREIPLARPRTASNTDRPNSPKSPSRAEGPNAKGETVDLNEDDEAELNPVQWIMVTRSDPGGGIPRFMVERGTPSSIIADASKFLNWACSRDFLKDGEQTEGSRISKDLDGHRSEKGEIEQAEINGHLAGLEDLSRRTSTTMTGQYDNRKTPSPDHNREPGIISQIGDVVESYTPQFIKDEVSSLQPTPSTRRRSSSSSESTSSSSMQSFADAEQFNTAPEPPPSDSHDLAHRPIDSTSSLSLASGVSPSPSSTNLQRSSTGSHEKELQKLDQRRRTLDDKLLQQKQKEEEKRSKESEKTNADQAKAAEKHDREVKKFEEKHQKELRKLEAKREKEAKKIEAKKKKAEEKDAWTRLKQENAGYKERIGYWERENDVLRQQLGELQKENTELVTRLGRMEGGAAVLQQMKQELRRGSVGTRGSDKSKASGGSKASVEKEKDKELVGGQA
ncbi:MAG: hypothetical protein M1820_004943 [Bogoriella megaspora]|nr:MAG: hypothetical protein M1820_004943 [Bogoriella megaspora]